MKMIVGRIALAALAALPTCFGVLYCDASPTPPAVKPIEVFQGEILQLNVPGNGLVAVEGRWGKEAILFYPNERGAFSALLGVDLEAKPGPAKVFVNATRRGGGHRESQIALKVKPKAFEQEFFSVPPQFDQFSPDVLERIRREQDQLGRIFSTSTAERLWSSPFMTPVQADLSSSFGYRRVINGTPRAPHTGVDLRVPEGTEVLAANNSRVVLVGDFFFSGKSLVLDHGAGLYTMYFHLSELRVQKGDEVRRGQVIGLSGMTGRVTGPHLHWGARLNGARVDPFELLKKAGGMSGENSDSASTANQEEK
jgi:murein DD-endopeptidase MepM/ murein hydrolase activator NlpD